MAVLDRRKTGPDYAGGVSDPRLVRRLDLLPVTAKAVTPDVRAAALAALTRHAQASGISNSTVAILRDMIFGDEA